MTKGLIVLIILLSALSIILGVINATLYVQLTNKTLKIEELEKEIERLRSAESQVLLQQCNRSIEIPVYTGNNIYGHIRCLCEPKLFEDILSYAGVGNGTWVIMFGSTGCPHCKAMDNFFKQNYPDIYRALWVDTDTNARSLFLGLYHTEICNRMSDIAGGVPHVVIFKNRSVSAIVVGEYTQRDLWDKLLGS